METLIENIGQVSVKKLCEDVEILDLLQLFEQIASEQNWKHGDQLRGYPCSSVYFALNIHEHLVGGLQLVVGSPRRMFAYSHEFEH